MHKKIMTLLIALLSLSSSLIAQSIQYENQVIQKLDVQIMTPSSTEKDVEGIKARIRTRQGDVFSQTEFDNDLKTIAKEYDRILPSLESIDGQMFITLKVWPKPTIRTITWQGNDKLDTKTLQKELGIATCSVFDRLSFNKAFNKLKGYYVKKGFFEAELEYNVTHVPETNEVDIVIAICEGRAGRIKSIVFHNFTSDEEEEILEKMVTKEYNFFLSWLNNEGTYHQDMMQQDQFTILNYIQNEGYADAKIDIDICEAKESNRIVVNINLNRGPLYSLGELTFEGNKLFCDEDIWKQFREMTKSGEPYSPEEIRETVQSIMTFYGKRGYIDTLVNFEPTLREDCHVYDVHFTIEEGERFRVGLIKVFGNCSTQTNVILHETLLVPGQVFNTEKLQKTEERLQNIGFFSHVNVYAVKSDGPCGLGGNYRDVHIEVEETSTGNFSAFAGFSTVESMFGGITVTEKNFNYKGLPRLFCDGYKAIRGGGEYASISATIGTKSRSYVLSWTKPYFMDTQWDVGFDLDRSSTRYVSEDYSFNSLGFTLHAGYQVNPFLRTAWHYRMKNTIVDVTGDKCKNDALHRQAKNSGFISAIGVSLFYDSTDNQQRPSNGFRSRLDGEFVGVGGEHTYVGLGYLNSYYIQTDKKGVLKFRGDAKFLVPMFSTKETDIPIDERLFLGGEDFLRGFKPYKLGPQFTTEEESEKDGIKRRRFRHEPAGGTSLQLLSVEYMRRLNKRLDGFVFCDSGHLANRNFAFGRMYTSIGYGIRLKFLDSMPPLTLGMGYPLNEKNRGQRKRFFLTIGGKF